MRLVRSVALVLAVGALAVGLVMPAAAGQTMPAAGQTEEVKAVPASSRKPALHPAQSNGTPIGSIRIPAIGISETVRSGVALSVIDQGVAHWAGTALPGEQGNVVLAGHRTIKTRPFYDLDLLNPGDLVYLRDGRGFDVIYRVTHTFIVTPQDIWITYDQGRPMLTMFACHPKGSQSRRIVVQADMVGNRRIA